MSRMFDIVTKTFNPIVGCSNRCVYCWSMRLANTRLRRKYFGFNPRFYPERLKKIPKKGFIFLVDMGDMFCDGVKDEWIEQTLTAINKSNTKATFLILTKNPERIRDFIHLLNPERYIVGATIETDDDELYKKHHISNAPLPSRRYRAMKNLNYPHKFISIEPILDFNLDRFFKWVVDISPELVYVGYDNYNNKLPEPPLSKSQALINMLKTITTVREKTIRRAWWEQL